MARSKFLGLRGRGLRTAMVGLVMAPSFILFGYNNGSTGGITRLPAFYNQFPDINTVTTKGDVQAHNATVLGIVVGCYDLGAVIGSLLCIGYSEKIGRLKTLLVGLIISIIALAIESSAFTLPHFVIGRLLIGLGLGTVSAVVPVWQAECASTVHRGAFVVLEGSFISLGITLSEWVEFGLSFASEGAVQWRVALIFPAIMAIFVLPFLFVMPESPRWLARKGRLAEARSVLAALADEEEDGPTVTEDMQRIEYSLTLVKGNLKELFHNGEERVAHRALLGALALMMQQMCGISALVFYTRTIFAGFDFSEDQTRILATCLTTFQTCCSLVPMLLVDKVGRRTLFMVTGAGLSVCMAVMAGTGGAGGSANIAAAAFVFLYNFFFPLGFLGQSFLYATEIAPLRLRVPITAIANATQWLSQFVVAQVTPPGTSNLGSRYWIIWAVLNMSFVVVIYYFFPETNGLSLEDMDVVFKDSNSIFDTVKVAKQMRQHTDRMGISREVRDLEEKTSEGNISQHEIVTDSKSAHVVDQSER